MGARPLQLFGQVDGQLALERLKVFPQPFNYWSLSHLILYSSAVFPRKSITSQNIKLAPTGRASIECF